MRALCVFRSERASQPASHLVGEADYSDCMLRLNACDSSIPSSLSDL